LTNYGSTIAAAIKSSKNPNNDTIKGIRAGTGGDNALQTAYTSFKSAYAKTFFQLTSRRKRASCNYFL
jgi:hypothetical protein